MLRFYRFKKHVEKNFPQVTQHKKKKVDLKTSKHKLVKKTSGYFQTQLK